MSKSTVRKEVVHPGHGDQTPKGSSATDEFERYFAEQFRPTPVVSVAAPAPVVAPVAPVVGASTAGAVGFDDPLMAELARIVSQQGVQRAQTVTTSADTQHNPPPSKSLDPLAAFEEELRRFDEMHRQAAQQSAQPAPAPVVEEPVAVTYAQPEVAQPAHITALENELRNFDSHPAPELRGMAPEHAVVPPGPEGLENEYQQSVPDLSEPPVPVAASDRSKRVVMMLGAASVIALVGVVSAVVMKVNKSPSRSGTVPVIAANGQPMKEKPADPGGVEITGQDRQVLAKGSVEAAKPATMVNKEEQPVDLNQTPKREVSRVILPPSSGQAPAAAAPIIMPPSAPAPVAAAPAPQAQPTQAGGFEAKRVRSVKVGPEGDAVAGAAPAAAPATAATIAAAPPPVAAPAQPKADAPRTAAVTPKSEARPATAVKAQTTTPQPQRQAARTAPAAAADDDDDAADNKPLSLRPPVGSSPTRPVARTNAATTPQTTASTNGGGFSVQLAAAGSEAEARSTASSMKQKYSALSGYNVGSRTSEVNGRTVYRVRVSNLSRTKATELCGQIKSSGGSCFVASN